MISAVRRRIDDIITTNEDSLFFTSELNESPNDTESTSIDVLVQRAQRYLYGQIYDTRTLSQKSLISCKLKKNKSSNPAKELYDNLFNKTDKKNINVAQSSRQKRITSSVFSAVILGELCQELAAFAEQHAILALRN